MLVNKQISHCSGLLTRDSVVRGLILPQIVREVLKRLVETEQKTEDWVVKWSAFALNFGFDDPPDSDDEDEVISEWIDGVVSAFSTAQKFASFAEEHLQKVANE